MSMLEQYLEFTEDTEPRDHLHRWSFICCVSAALGRNVKLPFGRGFIYPNLYVFFVGPPGSRKSTAILMAKKLLESSGFGEFAATKSSKQKFLLDWEEREGDAAKDFMAEVAAEGFAPNNMFVACDEMLDFLGPSNLEFLSLLTTLWDNLDKYEERLKNSKSTCIYNPTVSILGGFTPTGLQTAVPQEAAGTGFLSRLILVHADGIKRRVAWPAGEDKDKHKEFVDFFKNLQAVTGKFSVSSQAKTMLTSLYENFEGLEDGRFQYYCSRRHTNLLKLCMVVAVINHSDNLCILADDVIQANTILSYTEVTMPLALGEFGKSKLSEPTQKIIQALQNKEGPMDVKDLFKVVINDVDKYGDFCSIMQNLVRTERIMTQGSKFLLRPRKHVEGKLFVDYARYIPENPRNEHHNESEELAPIASILEQESPDKPAW